MGREDAQGIHRLVVFLVRDVDLLFEIEIRGGKRPNPMLHWSTTTTTRELQVLGKVARRWCWPSRRKGGDELEGSFIEH